MTARPLIARTLASSLAILLYLCDASAQSYPVKPVRLIVASSAGSNPDVLARIVSAGLALSPYRRDPAYSATEERRKAVWLEFERPPDDAADRYYARVLASAPDPALTDETEGLPDPGDLPLPIDPEPIRRIVPGQGGDPGSLLGGEVRGQKVFEGDSQFEDREDHEQQQWQDDCRLDQSCASLALEHESH